jgi:hypothetical protein
MRDDDWSETTGLLDMNELLEISAEVVSFFEFLFTDLEIISLSRKAISS